MLAPTARDPVTSSRIDPYEFYDQEPAPMGISDFGLTSGTGAGSAYAYNTTAVRGTVDLVRNPVTYNASLDSVGAGASWLGIQLNAMLAFTNATGDLFVYWVQDVAVYDTSSQTLVEFVDNIWNQTGPRAEMLRTSVVGNGTIESSSEGDFYVDVANANTTNGTTIPLVAPGSLALEMDTELTASGQPRVNFTFYDGRGQTGYDAVTFPWAADLSEFLGFAVDGSDLDPAGLPYDIELDLGGPGGGSRIPDNSSDLRFQIQYFNGHNFQSTEDAFNFGAQTAETVYNVQGLLAEDLSNGNLSSVLLNGTQRDATPGQLYSLDQVAVLNVSDPGVNGTLFINNATTPFTGGQVRVVLAPGTYNVTVASPSGTTALGACPLTAGEIIDLTVPQTCGSIGPPLTLRSFTVTPDPATVGDTLRFTTTLNGSEPPLTFEYGGLPAGCRTQNVSDLTCVGTSAGTYNVSVTVSGANGLVSGHLELVVQDLPAPVVASFALNATPVYVNRTVLLEVVANGGDPPLSYSYLGLPEGCTSVDTPNLLCTPTAAGNYTVTLTVSDSEGRTAGGSVSISVLPVPHPASDQPSATWWGPLTSVDLWLGIIGIVAALCVIGAVLSRRSRSRYVRLGRPPQILNLPPGMPPPAPGYIPGSIPPGAYLPGPAGEARSDAPMTSPERTGPLSAPAAGSVPAGVTALRFCPMCGSAVGPGHLYCGRCGRALP
ncbi:MAG: thermopsin [Thermoplasmata archaeon]